MILPTKPPRILPRLLNQGLAILRCWPWRFLGTLSSILLLVTLTLWGYQATAEPVTLQVDGVSLSLHTHRRLVGSILRQANLTLGPSDEVIPGLEAAWQPGQEIVVRRAFPVTVRADGRNTQLYGRPRSLLEVLARAAVDLHPGDLLYANNTLVPESAYADEAALLSILQQETARRRAALPPPAPALEVEVIRAIAVLVQDDGLEVEIRTTAVTLGAALEQAGFQIYRADQVYPPLDTPISPGLSAQIDRASPLQIVGDGRSYTVHTHAETVGDLLAEEEITLAELDRVNPSPQTPLQPDMTVQVVRVTQFDLVEELTIPFNHRQEPDADLELDQYRLRPGEEGLNERVTQVTYEDGDEVSRLPLGERVVREPVDQILYYGTHVVIRTAETPNGTIEYWRRLRVWATSYYPSTCDKTPDHPLYGITYTGRRATRGIIAVDPRVIPLHTQMYVPGYGFGAAEDIGGAIRGLHIDLCFDDADQGLGLWSTRYVDVYLLTPVPSRIPYIIP